MTMRYGTVQGVTKPVSRLVLGSGIVSRRQKEKSFDLLDAALELGYTTFDTAHVYGGGESERGIGDWMESRGSREKVVILDKGAHHNADRKRVTPFDITSDLFDSLARLKTDYIDIYLLHRDDPALRVGPIVEVLNEHFQAGRIRSFGGSNWRHERIQEADDYARSNGLVPFTASSPHFSLAEQVADPWGAGCVTLTGSGEGDARSWYRRTGMPVFAYSSLGRGLFSGRITRVNFEQIKSAIDSVCVRAYCHECNFLRLDRAELLAKEKNVSVAQIALAYAMNQPLNMFALVGAENRTELQSNIEGLALKLAPEEMEWLNLDRDTR